LESLEPTFGYAPHAAAKQVCDNLTATFGVTDRRAIPAFGDRHFTEVIPIVVYLEPILRFGLATATTRQAFRPVGAGNIVSARYDGAALVYMHVDDFNLIAQYLRDGDTSLIDILHEKYQRDRDHVTSFSEFWLENMRPGLEFPVKGNAVTSAEWQQYGDQALSASGGAITTRLQRLRTEAPVLTSERLRFPACGLRHQAHLAAGFASERSSRYQGRDIAAHRGTAMTRTRAPYSR